MFKVNLLWGIFLFAFTSFVNGQQKIQLLFDANCIDKMEQYFTKSALEKPMETYAWRANSNSTVFFECDFSKIETTNSLPKGVKKCGELPLTSDMVKDFQAGRRDLFLVWPNAKGGFSSAPVASAALALRNGSKTTYMEKGLTFTVDDAQSFDEKNLADANDDFFVYQLSRSVLECEPIFRVRKESKQTCQPFSIYEFSPKYGIVRENSGLTQHEADQNEVALFKINGEPYIDILKKGCGQNVAQTVAATTYSTQPERVVFQQPAAQNVPTDWKQVDEFRDRATTAGGGTRFDNWSEATAQPVAQTVTVAAPSCQMPEKAGYHLVQKGDFLNKISREHGVALADLRKWNGLQKSDKIYPCTYLRIAAAEKTAAPKTQKTVAAQPKIYTYEAPRTVAPTAQPVVYSTQPAGDPSMKKATKRPLFTAAGCSGNLHEVRDGEYLYAIAKIYGTTAGELAQINGLDRFETLFPGDRLCIGSMTPLSQPEMAAAPVVYSSESRAVLASQPSPCSGSDRYSVREGDALWSLAQRFGYTTDRFARMNSLDPNGRLYVGQCLVTEICGASSGQTSNGAYIIPAEKPAEPSIIYINDSEKSWSPKTVEQTTAAPAPTVYSTGASGGFREIQADPTPVFASQPFELYYWKDGDTDGSVARKFGMDVSYLRQINALSAGEVIVVGQPVKVKSK